MKLIANSVFKLPDGNMTVPGAEIPVDSEKASEWVDKGYAYYVEGESTVKADSEPPAVSDNTEDGVNQNPDTVNQNTDEANLIPDKSEKTPAGTARKPRNKPQASKKRVKK